MKMNLIRRMAAGLLCGMILLSATACSKVGTLTPTGEGGYRNDKSNEIYYDAPGCYEAKSYVAEEVVAQNDGIDFYAVEGMEKEQWLYSPDWGILLYAKNQTLPTLAEMNVSGAYICIEDDKTTIAFDETDAEKVKALQSAYENGEELIYPGLDSAYSFRVKFYSAEYPWLLYTLLFVQYSEDYTVEYVNENGETVVDNYGKNFLYDRFGDRFVAIGDEMQGYIDEYYHNVDVE